MRHTLVLSLALTAAALLAACGDEVTDPGSLIDAAEAEAVMRSAEALPLLPSLADGLDPTDDRDRAALVRARELWDAGSSVTDPRAGMRRRLAIGYALPVLMDDVTPAEWIEARRAIESWMRTVNDMLAHLSMPPVEAQLRAAELQLDRSDRSMTDRSRIYYLLLASSELVETTPRYVARSMALRADTAVLRAREADSLPERVFERAERLKNWAVLGVEKGEYLLAIQRAYYAIQLAEGADEDGH